VSAVDPGPLACGSDPDCQRCALAFRSPSGSQGAFVARSCFAATGCLSATLGAALPDALAGSALPDGQRHRLANALAVGVFDASTCGRRFLLDLSGALQTKEAPSQPAVAWRLKRISCYGDCIDPVKLAPYPEDYCQPSGFPPTLDVAPNLGLIPYPGCGSRPQAFALPWMLLPTSGFRPTLDVAPDLRLPPPPWMLLPIPALPPHPGCGFQPRASPLPWMLHPTSGFPPTLDVTPNPGSSSTPWMLRPTSGFPPPWMLLPASGLLPDLDVFLSRAPSTDLGYCNLSGRSPWMPISDPITQAAIQPPLSLPLRRLCQPPSKVKDISPDAALRGPSLTFEGIRLTFGRYRQACVKPVRKEVIL
jgi:hypothetical protein